MIDEIALLYFISFCILVYNNISLGIIKAELDIIEEKISTLQK